MNTWIKKEALRGERRGWKPNDSAPRRRLHKSSFVVLPLCRLMIVSQRQVVICEHVLDRCRFVFRINKAKITLYIFLCSDSVEDGENPRRFRLKMSPTGNERHKSPRAAGTNVPAVSHQLKFFTTWKESSRLVDTFQPGRHCLSTTYIHF